MGAAASIDTKISYSYQDLQDQNFIKLIPNCHEKTLAIYACNFPEILNERVLEFINSFVNEGENYSIVYFHGGIKVKPGFNWIREAYRKVDYSKRKMLQALYIVHPNFWVRSFTLLMKPLVSDKVWRKITYIYQLSNLNEHIPLSRFRETIPTQIFTTDKTFSQNDNNAIVDLPKYGHIGVSLKSLKERDQGKLVLFDACLKFLQLYGEGVEGIFRINPDRAKMFGILKGLEEHNQMSFNFITGNENDTCDSRILSNATESDLVTAKSFTYYEKNSVFIIDNIHLVAGILKLFLKELPESIIPQDNFEPLLAFSDPNLPINNSLPLLSPESIQLFKLFNKISKNSSQNKMTPKGIAICFGPVLCGHENTLRLGQEVHRLISVYTRLIEFFESDSRKVSELL